MSITKSQLEIFVETYLKSLKSHLIRKSDRKYIQKAINMITAITTDSPCCSSPTEIINLFTPFDNKLTNTVRVFLTGIDRRKYKQSIERTISLLNNSILSPCCIIPVTFKLYSENFEYSNVSVAIKIFTENDVLIFETLPLNGTIERQIQIANIPNGRYKISVVLSDIVLSNFSDTHDILFESIFYSILYLTPLRNLSREYKLQVSP